MSNLGAYQWITTTSKKVGGPVNLLLLTGMAGAAVYKFGEIAVVKCVRAVKEHKAKKITSGEERTLHHIIKPGISNEGLAFETGDQFQILETDVDAVLIEKIGDENNPYFVSAEFLRNISDYA